MIFCCELPAVCPGHADDFTQTFHHPTETLSFASYPNLLMERKIFVLDSWPSSEQEKLKCLYFSRITFSSLSCTGELALKFLICNIIFIIIDSIKLTMVLFKLDCLSIVLYVQYDSLHHL